MCQRLFPIFAGLAAILAGLPAVAEAPLQQLGIAAKTPAVTVGPLAAGRTFVALPTLEFRLRLEPLCADGWQARSVSVSVADTRLTLTPDGAPQEDGALEASLTVPAAQLAPLPVAGFCELPAEGDRPRSGVAELTIEAAVSAQAALLCANDDGERLTFVAKPLAVTLVCDDSEPGIARPD